MILPWNMKYVKENELLNRELKEMRERVQEVMKENRDLHSMLRLNRTKHLRDSTGIIKIMGKDINVKILTTEIRPIVIGGGLCRVSGSFLGEVEQD